LTTAVTLLVVGPGCMMLFLRHVLPLAAAGQMTRYNYSIVAPMSWWLHIGIPDVDDIINPGIRFTAMKLCFDAAVVAATAVFALAGRSAGSARRTDAEFVALALASLVLSPVNWLHSMAVGILPLILVVPGLMAARRAGMLAGLAVAYCLTVIVGSPAYYLGPLNAYVHLSGVLFAWALALRYAAATKRAEPAARPLLNAQLRVIGRLPRPLDGCRDLAE